MKSKKTVVGVVVFVICLSGVGILLDAWGQQVTPQLASNPVLSKASMDRHGRTPIFSLPYVINEPGSYVVMTDLIGVSQDYGITIDTDDVTVDLNGFTLTGVSGSYDGIMVNSGKNNIAIFNGVIRNWDWAGVDADDCKNNLFEDLRCFGNSQSGLRAGHSNTIVSCVSANNGSNGFSMQEGCVIKTSTAFGNGFIGIKTFSGCVVSECTSRNNTDDGIFAEGSIVENCSADSNIRYGIDVSSSLVRGCFTQNNGAGGINLKNNSISFECHSP